MKTSPAATSPERDSFRVGNHVRFSFRGAEIRGVVNRINPKRAVVAADNGEDYHVPYALLVKESDEEFTPNGVLTRSEPEIARFADQAVAAMKKHCLSGWTFRFDNATKRAGCCNYSRKVISLSRQFAQAAGEAEITDTILHEIAHALIGREHGHDATWRAKARKLGCSGERCHDVQFSSPRLIMSCANGCWIQAVHRRRRGVCGQCGSPLNFQAFTSARWEAMEKKRANI